MKLKCEKNKIWHLWNFITLIIKNNYLNYLNYLDKTNYNESSGLYDP